MKRLSITAQISIVFIIAALVTNLSLVFFVTNRLNTLYVNRIYEALEAEAKAIRLTPRGEIYETLEGYGYIKYYSNDNTYYVSDDMMDYIDGEAINLLIGKAQSQKTYIERYENIINGNKTYYVVLNYQGVLDISEDVTIALVDGVLKTKMLNETRVQMFVFNFLFFMMGYIVILIWISKFARDTKDISNTLKKIGDNHYRTKVTTNRRDEMGELVESIEAMRRKIIENERLKQEIIQGVSHDLKTPIALISSYAEAYTDGMCEAGEMADIAKKETKRLNAKVTKLLNLTRLGYIDKNLKTSEKTDMKEMISEHIKLYDYQEKIKIRSDLEDCSFSGDRESWLIAIQNILDNAMRYAKTEIVIRLSPDRLEISNDGKKIDEAVLSSIFEAYEKGTDGNSGIGLSIVKRTVEMFGYSIKAQNRENEVSFIISK